MNQEKIYHQFARLAARQTELALAQEEVLDRAADVIARSMAEGGVLHVFGCGHSQMFGEELCFRTGGLVPVNAIMVPQYNIHPHVKLSQIMERQEGVAKGVLESMHPQPQDVMLVVSISGRNPAGIDMALAAREMGMMGIALTSLNYSENVTSRHSSGQLLKDVSDVVIDMGGIKGDAALEHEKVSERFCSPSTVVGMTLLIGVMGEATVKLAEMGIDPPLWVSGNLDRGDAANQKHLEAYRGRVDIL